MDSIKGRVVLLLGITALMMKSEAYKIVQTPLGSVRGLETPVLSGNISQFRAIPYAKPPVKELRLRKPVPFGNWSGILDATEFGPNCIQDLSMFPRSSHLLPNFNTSEDCLHLNIFVPESASSSNRKSVMIWIYGGGFVSGQSGLYDGSYLTEIGDVIVVTVNYRLGILGFYSTGDEAAPGNFGLWDQLLAMKWVKNNIAAFGGDPNSITIFGESAGSISVSLHSFNPDNKDLFHRVIFESGTPLQEAVFNIDIDTHAKAYALLMNCTENNMEHRNTTEMVECIRTKTAQEVLNSQMDHIPNTYREYFNLMPVLDGDLIKQYPLDIVMDSSSPALHFLQSLDILGGTNSGEGSLFLGAHAATMGRIWNISLTNGISRQNFCSYVAPQIATDFYHNQVNVANDICQFYQSHVDDGDQALKMTQMYGDMLFQAPTASYLYSHARNNTGTKTFQYLLSHEFCTKFDQLPAWFRGVPHAGELSYLWRPKFIGMLLNTSCPVDTNLSLAMISYWSNFAKTGDPNGQGVLHWPIYDIQNMSYIDLNTSVTLGEKLYWDRVSFWNHDIHASVTHDGTSGHQLAMGSSLLVGALCLVYIFIVKI